jgi:Uma2 family endonuclease
MSVSLGSRILEPGTTGWTVADLDDPAIESQWVKGRYEIVEGVLTTMPAAYYAGSRSLYKLMFAVSVHLASHGEKDGFAPEVDIVIDNSRVVRADAVFLTSEDQARQGVAVRVSGKRDSRRQRILVPPTLIIESVSPGHEMHDLHTKEKWYSEFGVKNYWILDGFEHSLKCLILAGKGYDIETSGRETDELQPSVFPGLRILLGQLWSE